MDKTLMQIIRFLIVGVVVVLFNLSLLYLFTDLFHVWYLISSVLSWVLAVILNFTLQKKWVFNNNSIGHLKKQFIIYIGVSLAYLLANTSMMYILVSGLHAQYLLSQTGIICVLATINFFINRDFIFLPK